MKRMMCVSLLSLLMLLVALSASAEDVRLQAEVPGDAGPEPGKAGTIELTVTVNEPAPAVMENYSSVGPSAVPEPSTLVLVGLGIVGLGGWQRLRKQARPSIAGLKNQGQLKSAWRLMKRPHIKQISS